MDGEVAEVKPQCRHPASPHIIPSSPQREHLFLPLISRAFRSLKADVPTSSLRSSLKRQPIHYDPQPAECLFTSHLPQVHGLLCLYTGNIPPASDKEPVFFGGCQKSLYCSLTNLCYVFIWARVARFRFRIHLVLKNRKHCYFLKLKKFLFKWKKDSSSLSVFWQLQNLDPSSVCVYRTIAWARWAQLCVWLIIVIWMRAVQVKPAAS